MAGTITHSWKGTVLTITSDAGTSSADLGGATGCRGPQGRPGVVYDNAGKILVNGMASLEYVDDTFDYKTLIRDKDGKISTAVGGSILEKVESEFLTGMDSVTYKAVDLSSYNMGQQVWLQEVSAIEWNKLDAGQSYNYYFTLSNGAVVELRDIKYTHGGWQTIENNDYFTSIQLVQGNGVTSTIQLTPVNFTEWSTNNYTIDRLEIHIMGYTIYNPIDGHAIPVDTDNITLNSFNQLTVSPNVVVESRMAEYVEEQIDLAKIGGDDPAAVLINYYTRAEVDARIKAELDKILSSEEVEY